MKTDRENSYDRCAENSDTIRSYILHYYLKQTERIMSTMREKASTFFMTPTFYFRVGKSKFRVGGAHPAHPVDKSLLLPSEIINFFYFSHNDQLEHEKKTLKIEADLSVYPSLEMLKDSRVIYEI
jgi:hypothetical protein